MVHAAIKAMIATSLLLQILLIDPNIVEGERSEKISTQVTIELERCITKILISDFNTSLVELVYKNEYNSALQLVES